MVILITQNNAQKLINKRVAFLVIFINFFVLSIAGAEQKVFTKEYSYQANDADSKLSSRAIALELVKRSLLEELGTYILHETEIKNLQLTQDQVVTLTAGVVKTKIIKESWDGAIYYIKAEIATDPNEVAKSIDIIRKDKVKTNELRELRKKENQALKELEELKNELSVSKENAKIYSEYERVALRLSARDKNDQSIDAFSKAIELDPKAAYLYVNRGNAYKEQLALHRAIKDYDKAIELDPQSADVYNNRGYAYLELGHQQKALNDFNMAIELNPEDVAARINRAGIYRKLRKYQEALNDLNIAIDIEPQRWEPYNERSNIYTSLGDKERATADIKMLARMGRKDAQQYLISQGMGW